MIIKLTLLSTMLFAGILQGIFQIFRLILLNGRLIVNKLMVLAIAIITIIITQYFLVLSGGYRNFAYLLGITESIIIAIGPTLFLYIRQIFFRKKLKLWDLMHYLPVLILIYLYLPLISLPHDYKVSIIENQWLNPAYFSWQYFTYLSVLVIHMSFYLMFTILIIKRNCVILQQNTSNAILLKLHSIRFVMGLFISFMLLFIIIYSFFSIQYQYAAALESMLMLSMGVFIFILGHISFRNREIYFAGEFKKEESKYKSSPLSPEKSSSYVERLKEEMDQSKPYLNPDLKLQDIANDLDIPKHHLSQILNQELKMNFFDFVNHYRIEAVKKELTNPSLKHITIYGIALQNGFSNKASFNRVFKNITKMTPSQYIKSQVPLN